MKGVNKTIIVGNLGNDPEVTHSQQGTVFAKISIATSESWKDKQTGQKQERTDWHTVKFSGRLAEIAGEYLRKGSKVYIEGKNRTDKYQDQNGNDKYAHYILANEMQMLGSRGDQGQQKGGHQQQQNQGYQQQGGYQQPQNNGYQNQQQGPQNVMQAGYDDDDIPY